MNLGSHGHSNTVCYGSDVVQTEGLRSSSLQVLYSPTVRQNTIQRTDEFTSCVPALSAVEVLTETGWKAR